MAKSKKSSISTAKGCHPLVHSPVVISDDDRQRMVSEAAYYLAEHRGFTEGDELVDWITAEHEIDAKLMLKME